MRPCSLTARRKSSRASDHHDKRFPALSVTTTSPSFSVVLQTQVRATGPRADSFIPANRRLPLRVLSSPVEIRDALALGSQASETSRSVHYTQEHTDAPVIIISVRMRCTSRSSTWLK